MEILSLQDHVLTWRYTQVSHLFMRKASSWSCYECLKRPQEYRREVSAWVSMVHWPWLGQTVNGSALLPHGPRPKLRTCPNNKDGNMEEVSSNQIPATEHNGCGIIMPAQLYNVTLNFSRAEICSDVLEEFPLLSWPPVMPGPWPYSEWWWDDDLMHTARCESQ